jgi:FkbM family methyltransferase
MLQEVDEEDPELVSFVKSLIIEPQSNKKLNLVIKNKTDFSQIGQSKYIDTLLGRKRNGFFIEAGGYDGEDHSNTLFFELERDWTGILIEPIPRNYQKLISKNRKVYTINACIADNKPIVAKFRVLHVLSGRVKEMSDKHQQRIDKKGKEGNTTIDSIAYIPCFSLRTILKAINVDRVDYFSLDVEGGEWSILKNFNLNTTYIKSFTIECSEKGNKVLIKNFMDGFDYKLMKDDGLDLYFIKN